MVATQSKYISAGQAGRRLGVSDETVRRLVMRGALPAMETPLGRLFLPEDVERVRLEREQSEKVARA